MKKILNKKSFTLLLSPLAFLPTLSLVACGKVNEPINYKIIRDKEIKEVNGWADLQSKLKEPTLIYLGTSACPFCRAEKDVRQNDLNKMVSQLSKFEGKSNETDLAEKWYSNYGTGAGPMNAFAKKRNVWSIYIDGYQYEKFTVDQGGFEKQDSDGHTQSYIDEWSDVQDIKANLLTKGIQWKVKSDQSGLDQLSSTDSDYWTTAKGLLPWPVNVFYDANHNFDIVNGYLNEYELESAWSQFNNVSRDNSFKKPVFINTGLILGLSLGIGIPVVLGVGIYIYYNFFGFKKSTPNKSKK